MSDVFRMKKKEKKGKKGKFHVKFFLRETWPLNLRLSRLILNARKVCGLYCTNSHNSLWKWQRLVSRSSSSFSLRIKYLSPLRKVLLIITYFFFPTNRREISTRNPLIFQPTYVSRIYQSIDRIKTFNPIYLLIAIRSNDQSSLIKEQTESTVP